MSFVECSTRTYNADSGWLDAFRGCRSPSRIGPCDGAIRAGGQSRGRASTVVESARPWNRASCADSAGGPFPARIPDTIIDGKRHVAIADRDTRSCAGVRRFHHRLCVVAPMGSLPPLFGKGARASVGLLTRLAARVSEEHVAAKVELWDYKRAFRSLSPDRAIDRLRQRVSDSERPDFLQAVYDLVRLDRRFRGIQEGLATSSVLVEQALQPLDERLGHGVGDAGGCLVRWVDNSALVLPIEADLDVYVGWALAEFCRSEGVNLEKHEVQRAVFDADGFRTPVAWLGVEHHGDRRRLTPSRRARVVQRYRDALTSADREAPNSAEPESKRIIPSLTPDGLEELETALEIERNKGRNKGNGPGSHQAQVGRRSITSPGRSRMAFGKKDQVLQWLDDRPTRLRDARGKVGHGDGPGRVGFTAPGRPSQPNHPTPRSGASSPDLRASPMRRLGKEISGRER